MTAQKQGPAAPGAAPTSAGPGSTGAKRKAWVKKTPVEIILEQVAKQQQKVDAMRKELAKEEGELKKMQDATKMLQAK